MNTDTVVKTYTYVVGPNQIEYLRAVRNRYRADYMARHKVEQVCTDLMLTPDQVVENVVAIQALTYEPDDVCEDFNVEVTLIIKVYLPSEETNENLQGYHRGSQLRTG